MKFLSHPDAGAKALRSSGPDAGATVTGTNSDDILDGFDFDPATGLHSDDLLLGFGGNDYLYGYNGNDTLIGGKGRDYMIGGNGDDTYVLRAGDGVKNPLGAGVREEIGEGFDTIRIEGIAAADLRIWSDGGGYAFSIGGHNGRPGVEFVTTGMLSSGSSDFWRRYEAIEFDDGTVWTAATGLQLIGSNLGQFTEGTDLGDLIDGRNGDDYLYGYAGNDTLIGGKGNDYMAGGDGDDTYILRVGDGRAFAAGGGIREEIGAGYDTIRIEGIAAQDMRIWSDGGSYAFSLGRGGVEFVTTGMLSSGSSDFWRRYEAIEFDDGTVWTASTGLRLIGSNLGQFTEGTDLGDLIDGRGGDDYLYGYAGNDTLIGGKGEDYMAGGDGDDTYILRVGDGRAFAAGGGIREEFGAGYDTIRIEGIAAQDMRIWSDGGSYAFSLGRGGVEFVTTGMLSSGSSDFWRRYEAIEFDDGTVWTAATGLRLIGSNLGQFTEGTDLGDLIDGRNGDDYLYGYAGNDTLIGGKGEDYMAGGDGDDTYILRVGHGTTFGGANGIREEIGEGYDTIRIRGVAADDLRMWSDGTGYALSLGGTGGTPDLEFVKTSILIDGSSDFWRRIEAVKFDDGTVWTAATGLRIIGTNQGQFGEGTDLGDFIDGRGGDDYLHGHDGNDTISGGTGMDYITGGQGQDVFVYSAGMGLDRVADFIQGHDRIDLSGFAGASDFASLAPFIGGTFDTVLTFSASDSFVLFGVDPTALSAGDFLF